MEYLIALFSGLGVGSLAVWVLLRMGMASAKRKYPGLTRDEIFEVIEADEQMRKDYEASEARGRLKEARRYRNRTNMPDIKSPHMAASWTCDDDCDGKKCRTDSSSGPENQPLKFERSGEVTSIEEEL